MTAVTKEVVAAMTSCDHDFIVNQQGLKVCKECYFVEEDKKLKLFIWEGDGVLRDYSNGMIAVLAYNHSHALELIEQKCNYSMGSFPVNKYVVVEKPEAFVCWGGS